MQQTKYSDNVWIGNIPNNWGIKRFKHCINLYTGNSISDNQKDDFDDSDNANPYIASKDINRLFSRINYENGMYVKKNDYRFKFAHKGDSLLCIEGGSAGKKKAFLDRDVAFVNKLCCLHSKCFVNKKFLYYFILSPSFEEEFIYNISGLIGGVSVSKLNEFKICFPELQKQKIIVDFLDKKCGEIDGLISDIEKEIEILTQYKKSIITEIVTKGLDKNTKLKSTDIKWLPFLPESWSYKKAKYLFVQRTTKGNKNLQLLSPTQKFGVIPQGLYEELSGMVAVKVNEKTDLGLFKTINKGDFCISLRSFEGGFEFSNYDGVVSPAYTVFYPKINCDRQYFKYLFKTQIFIDEMNSYSLSLRDGKPISFFNFGNTYIPLPSIQEQKEIADYLDKKCKEIDSVLEDKNKQLETLESYKKSIIYEYVTGKKEVEND